MTRIEQKLLDNGYEGVVILDNPDYSDAAIGVAHTGQVVYEYDKMVSWLIDNGKMTEQEAIDWIDYNVISSLPLCKNKYPIILNSFIE